MRFSFRSVWPYLLIIAGFLIISLVYFFPQLKGYTLEQQDITNFQGMSKEIVDYRDIYHDEPLWTDALFGGMPAYQISVNYPSQVVNFFDDAMQLWLPRPARFLFLYMIGFFILLLAMRVNPWLAALGAVAFALSSYYLVIVEAGHNSKAHAIGYLAPTFAGIILTFRGRLWLGGGLTALFMTLQLNANHVQITYYFGILVAVYALAFFVQQIREKHVGHFVRSVGVLLAAVALALACNVNNLWNTYKYGKHTIRGESELTIKPDGSSKKDSDTAGLDRDYITHWSYGLPETWTLLIPNAKGGASAAIGREAAIKTGMSPQMQQQIARSSSYWGNQPGTSGPVYVGAIIVLLFLLGAFYVKGPLKWALLATAVLTIMLAWGKNFMGLTDFFIDNVPLYNKFRAVTIILSITEFVFPLLAIVFLHKIWKNPEVLTRNIKPFFYVSGGLLLLMGLFYITPDSFFSFLSAREQSTFASRLNSGGQQARMISQYLDGLEQVRMNIFRADVARSFILVQLAAVMLYFYANKTVNNTVLGIALFALVLIDMWTVDKRYLNNEKQRGQYVQWKKTERSQLAYDINKVDKSILQREVSQNPALEDSISKYMAKFKKAYRQDHGGNRKPGKDLLTSMRLSALRFSSHFRVLTLNNPFNDAGVSYYHQSVGGYHGAKLERYQELISFHISPEMKKLTNSLQSQNQTNDVRGLLQTLGVINMLNTKYIVYNPDSPPIGNPEAYGNAWFIDDLQWVDNADQEIQQLGDIDIRHTAIADKRFKSELGEWQPANGQGSMSLQFYKPNELVYQANVPKAQLAVLSEIYYPEGWQAYIDGEPVEHIRVNYVLRALRIPTGQHKIVFKYEPASFTNAAVASTAASIALALVVGFGLFKEVRDWKKKQETLEE